MRAYQESEDKMLANADESVGSEAQDKSLHGKKLITDKILHVLRIYPRLSPTMLQIGLGTSMPPGLWRPVLAELVANGLVTETNVQATAPTGRQVTYKVLSIAPAITGRIGPMEHSGQVGPVGPSIQAVISDIDSPEMDAHPALS